MEHYFHAVPGRIRVKSPLIKGNGEAEAVFRGLLQDQEGIHNLGVNTLTGSVVVNFDPRKVSSGAVLNKLAESGFFSLEKAVTSEQYLDSAMNKFGHKIGKALLGVALDQALGGTPLSLLTALI